MNDRFRFRAWNKEKKIMHYEAEKGATCLPFHYLSKSDEFICEQCTGLKDKNGRLIYEGDLFELEEGAIDTVREVIWDKDTSSFKVSCRGKEEYNNGLYNEMREYEELLDLSLFLDCACIIGNIHENADLLEAQNG